MANLYDMSTARQVSSCQANQPEQTHYQQPNQQAINISHGKSMGVASLVLGILGLISCLSGIGAFFGFIAAIIGLGSLDTKKFEYQS